MLRLDPVEDDGREFRQAAWRPVPGSGFMHKEKPAYSHSINAPHERRNNHGKRVGLSRLAPLVSFRVGVEKREIDEQFRFEIIHCGFGVRLG